jgi:hypothetical protein
MNLDGGPNNLGCQVERLHSEHNNLPVISRLVTTDTNQCESRPLHGVHPEVAKKLFNRKVREVEPQRTLRRLP